MAMDLRRYEMIKKKVDAAQSTADRAAGQRDMLLARLKTYGLTTCEAAEKRAAEIEQDAAAKEEKFNADLTAFELKHAAALNPNGAA